jgi:sugar phosphate isomerase/epimerase
MKIGILSILFDEQPLEGVLKFISNLGYEAIELPVWEGAHHINIDQILSGNADSLKKALEKYSITISALSNHPAGQLVLGPLDSSTDAWFKGTGEEKVKYGMERMKKTAEAAAALNVPVVNGFTGAPNWGA